MHIGRGTFLNHFLTLNQSAILFFPFFIYFPFFHSFNAFMWDLSILCFYKLLTHYPFFSILYLEEGFYHRNIGNLFRSNNSSRRLSNLAKHIFSFIFLSNFNYWLHLDHHLYLIVNYRLINFLLEIFKIA